MFSDILTCLGICIGHDSPEKQSHRIWEYREKEIYFKALAHTIMESDKFKSAWGLVVGHPREPTLQMKSEGYLLQCCLLLRGLKFCGCWSIQPDWVWPTHIREGHLLYSKVCVCACVHVCYVASVMSDSLQPNGLEPARRLCPWDSPGMNTGVGCHALL